jgi:hypothetical protein
MGSQGGVLKIFLSGLRTSLVSHNFIDVSEEQPTTIFMSQWKPIIQLSRSTQQPKLLLLVQVACLLLSVISYPEDRNSANFNSLLGDSLTHSSSELDGRHFISGKCTKEDHHYWISVVWDAFLTPSEVEELCCKSEGHRFDSLWGSLWVDSASNRNEYREPTSR